MRGNFVHEFVSEFGHPGMSDFGSEKNAPPLRGAFRPNRSPAFSSVEVLT